MEKGKKPKSQSGGGWINCDGALYCVFHKSVSFFTSNDCNYKVELAVTSGGRTRAGHHPSMDFPYEHMKLVPRLAPVRRGGENGDLLLKKQVRGCKNHDRQLGFLTTEHHVLGRPTRSRRQAAASKTATVLKFS